MRDAAQGAQLRMGATVSAPVAGYRRYPGPHSFSDNELDQRLFFGRKRESAELAQRIQAARMLVLFSKSGLGKTSLLQAGRSI